MLASPEAAAAPPSPPPPSPPGDGAAAGRSASVVLTGAGDDAGRAPVVRSLQLDGPVDAGAAAPATPTGGIAAAAATHPPPTTQTQPTHRVGVEDSKHAAADSEAVAKAKQLQQQQLLLLQLEDRVYIRQGLFGLWFNVIGLFAAGVVYYTWSALEAFAMPIFWGVLCAFPLRHVKMRFVDTAVAALQVMKLVDQAPDLAWQNGGSYVERKPQPRSAGRNDLKSTHWFYGLFVAICIYVVSENVKVITAVTAIFLIVCAILAAGYGILLLIRRLGIMAWFQRLIPEDGQLFQLFTRLKNAFLVLAQHLHEIAAHFAEGSLSLMNACCTCVVIIVAIVFSVSLPIIMAVQVSREMAAAVAALPEAPHAIARGIGSPGLQLFRSLAWAAPDYALPPPYRLSCDGPSNVGAMLTKADDAWTAPFVGPSSPQFLCTDGHTEQVADVEPDVCLPEAPYGEALLLKMRHCQTPALDVCCYFSYAEPFSLARYTISGHLPVVWSLDASEDNATWVPQSLQVLPLGAPDLVPSQHPFAEFVIPKSHVSSAKQRHLRLCMSGMASSGLGPVQIRQLRLYGSHIATLAQQAVTMSWEMLLNYTSSQPTLTALFRDTTELVRNRSTTLYPRTCSPKFDTFLVTWRAPPGLFSEVLACLRKADMRQFASYLGLDKYARTYASVLWELGIAVTSSGFAVLNSLRYTAVQALLFWQVLLLVVSQRSNKLSESFAKLMPYVGDEDGPLMGKILHIVSRPIRLVFVCTVNLALFYGISTWLLLSWAGVHLAITCGLLAAVFAVIPVLPPPTSFLPGIIMLLLSGHFLAAFTITVIASYLWWGNCYYAIVGDIPSAHPMITALSALGGLYVWNLPGVVIGPVIITLPKIMSQLYELYKQWHASLAQPAAASAAAAVAAAEAPTTDEQGSTITDVVVGGSEADGGSTHIPRRKNRGHRSRKRAGRRGSVDAADPTNAITTPYSEPSSVHSAVRRLLPSQFSMLLKQRQNRTARL